MHVENQPLISIIVPVYNSALFLDEAIKSICKQTWNNLEIILVEDGSADDSAVLCDYWKEKDSRVNVIHKQNAGVSAARNDGLKRSHGDLIFFMDSDDKLPKNAIEILYTCLVKEKAGFSVGRMIRFFPDGRLMLPKVKPIEGQIDKKDFLANMIRWNVQYSWGKLYTKSILQDNNNDWILFREDLNQSEDVEWLTRILVRNPTIICTNEIVYEYRKNVSNSASETVHKTYSPERIQSALKAYGLARETIICSGMPCNTSFCFRELYFITLGMQTIQNYSILNDNKEEFDRLNQLFFVTFKQAAFSVRSFIDFKSLLAYGKKYIIIKKHIQKTKIHLEENI